MIKLILQVVFFTIATVFLTEVIFNLVLYGKVTFKPRFPFFFSPLNELEGLDKELSNLKKKKKRKKEKLRKQKL